MGYRRIADRLRFAGGLRQQRPLLQVKPLELQAAEGQQQEHHQQRRHSTLADHRLYPVTRCSTSLVRPVCCAERAASVTLSSGAKPGVT